LPEAILSVQLPFAAIIAALNWDFALIVIGACVFVLQTAWMPTRKDCPQVRERKSLGSMSIALR